MALTLRGVIDRSIDDDEGLQSSDYCTYQIFEQDNLVFKLIDLENIKTSRVGYVPRRGIMSPAYIRLEKTSRTAWSRYYYWFFYAAYLNNIFNGMGGGVRQNLTPTDLLDFPIPLPSLETQKAIADFLDHETARIDQLIEKKQRLLDATSGALSAATFRELRHGFSALTYDPTKNRVDFSNMNSAWRRVRLKRVISHMTSGSRSWGDQLNDESEQLFLQSGCITRSMGVSFEDAERIAVQAGAEAERTRVRNGDTLVCITGGRTGAVGYIGGVKETAYVNQHVCLLRPAEARIEPLLLAQILFSEIGQLQFRVAQYGLKQGLGLGEVANVVIPCPPREIQSQLSDSIENASARLRTVSSHVLRSKDRLSEFKAALITAAVTGQIDVAAWCKRGRVQQKLDDLEMRAYRKEACA